GCAAADVPHTRAGERCELGVEVAQAAVGCAEVALDGLATERGAGREVVRALARRRRCRGTSLARGRRAGAVRIDRPAGRVGRAVDVACPGASRAEREAEHRPSHHPHRPPPARALARFPYRAGGTVLEQDALLAKTLANRIRFAEVLATPRLVARGDGRLDLGGAEAGALLAPSAHGLEELRGRLGEEPRGGADDGELAADVGRGRASSRVEQPVQLADAVEDEAET